MHIRGVAQGNEAAARTTQDCAAICVQTTQYCLEVGGGHAASSHVRLIQDCADICETTTKVLLRGGSSHESLAAACANICDACAAACEKLIGDAQMKACANQCRLCAIACRQVASNGAGIHEATFRGVGQAGLGVQAG